MNWVVFFTIVGASAASGLLAWLLTTVWERSKPDVDLGEVIQVHIDESPPHVADEMWQAIEDTFLMFDQKVYDLEIQHQYWVGDYRAQVQFMMDPPPELFVPKIAHFGPEVVREMEYCHATGSTVVHRKDCARAPNEDRRRWIWAFSDLDAADWAADEPGEWRPCGICKPYRVDAVGAAPGELPAVHAAAEATSGQVRA